MERHRLTCRSVKDVMAEVLVDAAGRFVDRRQELRVLDRLLDGARQGRSVAVAVVGEPGIGKTRLLGELRQRAEHQGCAVFLGRGSELDGEPPFGAVVEALDDMVGEIDPVLLKRLGDERLAELSQVFPALDNMGDRLASEPEVERFRCHYAVRALLKQLTRERPTVLMLDNVHRADPATTELVSYLLRRGVPGLLLAVTYHPRAPRLLHNAVARAVQERRLRLMELGPLSPDEAAKLLGGAVVPGRIKALYTDSGGNPLYLEHLAGASHGRADGLLPAGARWVEHDDVPVIVRAAIEQELDGLSVMARQIAFGAAVAGDPFEAALALEIAQLDGADAWVALDELMAAGIMRATEIPGRMQFRHPVIRRAVYASTGHGWRLGAHQRAAQGLARRTASLEAQAQHMMRSSVSAGDEDAIALLIEASRATAPRSPASAARWLDAAARLLPDDASAERRLDLLVPRATSLATMGRFQDSRTVIGEALGLTAADDVRSRVRLTTMLARVEHELGRAEDSRRSLSTALEESEPGTAEAAGLTLELAKNHSMLGEWDQAVHAAESALKLAHDLDDHELGIRAAMTRIVLEGRRLGVVANSDVELAVRSPWAGVEELAGSIDDLKDEEMTPSLLEALLLLVYVEIDSERWMAAERHTERAIRICQATGQGARFLEAMTLLVPTRMHQGRLSEARQAADLVAEAGHLIENDQVLLVSESMRCWLTSLQGETRMALAVGANALKLAERTPKAQFAWLPTVCYGEALAEAGQPEEGHAHIMAAGGSQLTDMPPAARPHWLKVLAELNVTIGRIDEADDAANQARTIADHFGLPTRKADACYAEAAVSLAHDQLGAAIEHARESHLTYEAAGMHLEAARARILLAQAMAGSGDTAAATGELEQAHVTFEAQGAVRLADRAAHELRQLGHRVVRRSVPKEMAAVSGPESLSDREREVASLVTQGHTTRQIAQNLFLSPKTIETHLAHIFAKLGVSSRAAMTAAFARAGFGDH